MYANIIPYNFIAIEGNIGAGKTTLCRLLAAETNSRLVLEQFSDNPFLPFFYENPERYAFSVELFFMTERHKQMQECLTTGDLFQQRTIADYFFLKTLLFAKNNLTDEEYRLFKRLFNVLNSTFSKPDLLVYLHRPVEELLSNIQQRGRSYEQDISADYLQQLQEAYFEYFKNEQEIPIVVIDLSNVDFLHERVFYKRIVNILQQPYAKGLHYLHLKDVEYVNL